MRVRTTTLIAKAYGNLGERERESPKPLNLRVSFFKVQTCSSIKMSLIWWVLLITIHILFIYFYFFGGSLIIIRSISSVCVVGGRGEINNWEWLLRNSDYNFFLTAYDIKKKKLSHFIFMCAFHVCKQFTCNVVFVMFSKMTNPTRH